jgi:hypothetical protein
MPIGLTGPEWSVLLTALVPAVLAVVVVVVVWRWWSRSEREEAMRAQQNEPPARDPDP